MKQFALFLLAILSFCYSFFSCSNNDAPAIISSNSYIDGKYVPGSDGRKLEATVDGNAVNGKNASVDFHTDYNTADFTIANVVPGVSSFTVKDVPVTTGNPETDGVSVSFSFTTKASGKTINATGDMTFTGYSAVTMKLVLTTE